MNDFFNVTLRPNSISFDVFGEGIRKRHWNEGREKYLPKLVGAFPYQPPATFNNYNTKF